MSSCPRTNRPSPAPPLLSAHLVHLIHTAPRTAPAPQVLPELPGMHPYTAIPAFTREESSGVQSLVLPVSIQSPTSSQFQLLKFYCCPRKRTPGIRWIKMPFSQQNQSCIVNHTPASTSIFSLPLSPPFTTF